MLTVMTEGFHNLLLPIRNRLRLRHRWSFSRLPRHQHLLLRGVLNHFQTRHHRHADPRQAPRSPLPT